MKRILLLLGFISAAVSIRYSIHSQAILHSKTSSLSELKDPEIPKSENQDSTPTSLYQSQEFSNYKNDATCGTNLEKIANQNVDYKKIQKQGTLWTDQNFKVDKAVGGMDLVFTRVSSGKKDIKIFGKGGITVSDLKQGGIGNCYFIAAVASLAEHPQYIKKMFLTSDNKAGIYTTVWYSGGRMIKVSVDDNFPTEKKGGKWIFAGYAGGDKELWPMILEKAWAKLSGGYRYTNAGQNENVLHAMTGAPFHLIEHPKLSQNQLYDAIEKADKEKYMMGTFPKQGSASCGLAVGHAYSTLSTIRDVVASDGKKYDLVKVRNPWADNQWKGDFSDTSKLWTQQLKKELKLGEDKGIIFLTKADYKKCLKETSITQTKENYKISFEAFNGGFKVQRKFTKYVKEKFTLSIETTPQRFTSSQTCYNPVFSVYHVLIKTVNNTKKIISQGTQQNKLVIRIEDDEPGEYELFGYPVFAGDGALTKYVLSIYSSQDVKFRAPTCEQRVDRKLLNGQPWHKKADPNMTCQQVAKEAGGPCWGPDPVFNGFNVQEACVICGGGECP